MMNNNEGAYADTILAQRLLTSLMRSEYSSKVTKNLLSKNTFFSGLT